MLIDTHREKIPNKQGELKEYLVGKFYDLDDNPHDIVIKPDDEAEILECDLGTPVQLNIKDVAGKKFAIGLEFIEKRAKKVAA